VQRNQPDTNSGAARCEEVGSPSRSSYLIKHDLF
jgi:hypothetical protein